MSSGTRVFETKGFEIHNCGFEGEVDVTVDPEAFDAFFTCPQCDNTVTTEYLEEDDSDVDDDWG